MFKVTSIYNKENETTTPTFSYRVTTCNNLFIQRKAIISQKYPSHVTEKLLEYIMQVERQTIKGNYPSNCWMFSNELEKTAVCSVMVGNTTVNAITAKDIPRNIDEMKMKSFVVFQGAKRETAELNKNLKRSCVESSISNCLINEKVSFL